VNQQFHLKHIGINLLLGCTHNSGIRLYLKKTILYLLKFKTVIMENVNVYSPIDDQNIRTNLNGSPIWKQAYHETELVEAEKKHKTMFCDTIKFDGLKPVQVTNVKKLAK